MATSIHLPWSDLRLHHREIVAVAPKPARHRFDKRTVMHDGETPPILWGDFGLRWLDDFLRDGWEIVVGKPLRELMERGALLMTGRANPLPGLTGLNRLVLPGLISSDLGGGPPSSSVITITNFRGPIPNQLVSVPVGVNAAWWVMVGRGGDGSSGTTISHKGAGGGAGCATKKLAIPVTTGAIFNLILGGSGAPSTITGTLLSTPLIANAGGNAPSDGSNVGGAGGTASGGDTTQSGGEGAPGTGTGVSGTGGGAGGTTSAGGAGVGNTNTNGTDATGDGGGGGGHGALDTRGGGGGAGRSGGSSGSGAGTVWRGGVSQPVAGSPLSLLGAEDGAEGSPGVGGVGGGGACPGNGTVLNGGIALAALLQAA